MFICKRVSHLREWLDRCRQSGLSIGFVPTMGALHEGHLSLVAESRRQCGVTCASIFVNPRQFNNPNDLKNYPRPVESDIKALYGAKADIIFIPEIADMYPADDPFQTDFEPGPLGETMEGEFRPGHFKGMVDVVYRLLRIVEPDHLFLGQKDFQQAAIISMMVKETALPVKIAICPTIRESNGLAMSSRNMRLTEAGKANAGLIYRELKQGKMAFESGTSAASLIEQMMSSFRAHGLDPEYVAIVDGQTLQPVMHYDDADYIVACCAIKVEDVRLIDNMTWKEHR